MHCRVFSSTGASLGIRKLCTSSIRNGRRRKDDCTGVDDSTLGVAIDDTRHPLSRVCMFQVYRDCLRLIKHMAGTSVSDVAAAAAATAAAAAAAATPRTEEAFTHLWSCFSEPKSNHAARLSSKPVQRE
jgi:hypothetical protein